MKKSSSSSTPALRSSSTANTSTPPIAKLAIKSATTSPQQKIGTPGTGTVGTGTPGSGGRLAKSGRQPLTPIQNKQTTGHGMMVKPSSTGIKKLSPNTTTANTNTTTTGSEKRIVKSPTTPSSSPSASSTPTASANKTSLYKIQSGFVTKRKEKIQISKADKEIQTSDTSDDIVTGDVAPVVYWKELAEQRRAALEEALKENEQLTEKVASLEKDKQELEEMVEQAKVLAEMINSISEEHGCTADESGIGRDAEESTLSKD